MQEQFLTELENLTDYEEVFHFIKGIVQTECNVDGMSMIVHDKKSEKYILMPEDLQWQDMLMLPESFVQKTFETKQQEIIDEPMSQTLCNQSIDCNHEKDVSSLLLFPILNKDERYDIVLSLWKVYENEKEEVIEPLIVGSQMIGATTRVKSIKIHRSFKKDDMAFLQSIETILLLAAKKLAEQTEMQKNAVINRIKENEQIFKTPQEIIATLINILMGTNTTLENTKNIIAQIKQQTHHNDKNMPHILHIEELMRQLSEHLLHTFQFTTSNNVIDELFKSKASVETKPFFEHFATTMKELVCHQNISMLFFLDARLPSKISIDRQNTYIFISELLQFALQYTHNSLPFEIRLTLHPQKPSSLIFRILYAIKEEHMDLHRTLFRDTKEKLDDALYLSYSKFIQTGGSIASSVDTDKKQALFSLSIPYEKESNEAIVTSISDKTIKVGLLLNKKEDMDAANNIARYLVSMGISKSQLSGAEKLELFKDDITHLIVFQSRFSDELFKNKLQQKPYCILTVMNGCQEDDSINFYDYSVVDMQIDQNQPCLDALEEFIQMEAD